MKTRFHYIKKSFLASLLILASCDSSSPTIVSYTPSFFKKYGVISDLLEQIQGDWKISCIKKTPRSVYESITWRVQGNILYVSGTHKEEECPTLSSNDGKYNREYIIRPSFELNDKIDSSLGVLYILRATRTDLENVRGAFSHEMVLHLADNTLFTSPVLYGEDIPYFNDPEIHTLIDTQNPLLRP